MDRRDFIQRLMRGGLLAGLLVIPGIFLSRRQVSSGSGCTGDFRCSSCGMLDRCTLPEAVHEREAGEGGKA
ncbi:MAG: hypothetical protein ACQERV_10020 [Bacteroidota bacterium]